MLTLTFIYTNRRNHLANNMTFYYTVLIHGDNGDNTCSYFRSKVDLIFMSKFMQ